MAAAQARSLPQGSNEASTSTARTVLPARPSSGRRRSAEDARGPADLQGRRRQRRRSSDAQLRLRLPQPGVRARAWSSTRSRWRPRACLKPDGRLLSLCPRRWAPCARGAAACRSPIARARGSSAATQLLLLARSCGLGTSKDDETPEQWAERLRPVAGRVDALPAPSTRSDRAVRRARGRPRSRAPSPRGAAFRLAPQAGWSWAGPVAMALGTDHARRRRESAAVSRPLRSPRVA